MMTHPIARATLHEQRLRETADAADIDGRQVRERAPCAAVVAAPRPGRAASVGEPSRPSRVGRSPPMRSRAGSLTTGAPPWPR